MEHPLTPDGRYMVVRGRLWRVANPNLSPQKIEALVSELMTARRQVKAAMTADDAGALAAARKRVNEAKVALGERGQVGGPMEPRTSTATWSRTHPTQSGLSSLTLPLGLKGKLAESC